MFLLNPSKNLRAFFKVLDNQKLFFVRCNLVKKKRGQKRPEKWDGSWIQVIHKIPSLEGAVVALVTDTDKGAGAHIRIANNALSVALLAQSPYCYPRLLPAHYQIWMVLCHLPVPPLRLLFLPIYTNFQLHTNQH